MTRPDNHAARFGTRYWDHPARTTTLTIEVNVRKFTNALREAMPIIRSITAVMRLAGEAADHWTFVPHIANPAAPTVAELEAGTPIRGLSHASAGTHSGGDANDIDASSYSRGQWAALVGAHAASPEFRAADQMARSQPAWPSPDILDRIDETLLTYDSQRATGEQPWPYREF